ncbi:MAG: tryptophan-rich sensory protein [Richelia sp.]|nr:tryptophan-rich sensory protein [Richelia sp.]
MSRYNETTKLEQLVNKVMGVKNGTTKPSIHEKFASNRNIDIGAILTYKLGTILQICLIILVLFCMGKLVSFIDSYTYTPRWANVFIAGFFFTLLSIRSRIFSPLDNTRYRTTYEEIIRPKWAPPPLVFPIVWMIIAVLRVISSLIIWKQMNQEFLVIPLILFVVHLAFGDTWNTIFTVERRLGAAVPVVILGPWLSALIVTVIYWKISPTAGIILAPSCVWLTVAAILVFRIWQLNGREPLYPLKLTS